MIVYVQNAIANLSKFITFMILLNQFLILPSRYSVGLRPFPSYIIKKGYFSRYASL